jgi:hypothetical protein
MRAAVSAIAIAIWLLASSPPAEAGASVCDDSDSDTSSTSSSDDDDDDDEPACEEISDVVGYSMCRRFGSWDAGGRPSIRVSAGTSFHRLPVSALSFRGSANHPESTAMSYHLIGAPGDERASGGSFDLQLTTLLGRHLYAGLEGSVGALTTTRLDSPTSSAPLIVEPGSLFYLSGSALAGAAVSAGGFRLRGEVGVGVRAVGLTVETRHDDCVASSTSYDSAFLVRPRVAAERWMTPWVSAGASVGTNLLERGETSVGLFLAGHLRAFDGGR